MMLNEGSYDDGCSLRMWNVRRTMAPKEWDMQRKMCLLRHGMGTWQEQDCAWGNGMDMGTVMKTRLNQTLNNVLNSTMIKLHGLLAILLLPRLMRRDCWLVCRFSPKWALLWSVGCARFLFCCLMRAQGSENLRTDLVLLLKCVHTKPSWTDICI